VPGHLLRVFERAAVGEISGNSGCAECVIADRRGWGTHCPIDATIRQHEKSAVVRTIWIVRPARMSRGLSPVGCCDESRKEAGTERSPSVLDVPALLADVPEEGLARGQVGTVVEQLDDKVLLVEFSDDHGRAYAVAPGQRSELLVLHYVPIAA
jgi:hypothetical protein